MPTKTDQQRVPSKTQAEVLEAVAEEGRAHYMRAIGNFNPNAYWFTGMKKCTAQVEASLRRGWLKSIPDGQFGDKHAVITDTGREALRLYHERQSHDQ